MQKNYVIFFLFFISNNNVIAQLPENLARFTQTLKNVAVKLEVKPKIIKSITAPLSNEVILPDGKIVRAPSGSIVEVRDTGILVKIKIEESDISEFNVTLPYAGFVEISDAASVQFPDGKIVEIPFGGKKVEVPGPGRSTIIIKPKNLVPPVPGGRLSHPNDVIRISVPADGIVALPNGEVIKVPIGSKVLIYSFGLETTVPRTGGDVQLPSTGGRVGIDYMFNATLELPDGSFKEISSNEYAKIFMQGVVKVIPKNTLPPIRDYVPFPVRKKIKVPGGRFEFPSGMFIEAPKETLVEELYDGDVVTVSPEGADVTIPFWGAYVGLPKGSPAVMVELSDGRKGEIVGGGYIIVPAGTTKIRPKFIEETKLEIGKIKLPEE